MSFLDLCKQRGSVRSFTDQTVEQEKLLRILEAGRLAPSATNRQPWTFYVVTNQEVKKAMFPRETQHWITEAPVVVVACAQPAAAWVRAYDQKNHSDVDLAICVEHMHLAAADEGLGSCWICAFDPSAVRGGLGLPEDLEPVAALPIGYIKQVPDRRPRKSLEEIIRWVT
ncbi:MAG: nitroreductase family protein [Armatimonadota bacterium]